MQACSRLQSWVLTSHNQVLGEMDLSKTSQPPSSGFVLQLGGVQLPPSGTGTQRNPAQNAAGTQQKAPPPLLAPRLANPPAGAPPPLLAPRLNTPAAPAPAGPLQVPMPPLPQLPHMPGLPNFAALPQFVPLPPQPMLAQFQPAAFRPGAPLAPMPPIPQPPPPQEPEVELQEEQEEEDGEEDNRTPRKRNKVGHYLHHVVRSDAYGLQKLTTPFGWCHRRAKRWQNQWITRGRPQLKLRRAGPRLIVVCASGLGASGLPRSGTPTWVLAGRAALG
jgi:hypothetical protein